MIKKVSAIRYEADKSPIKLPNVYISRNGQSKTANGIARSRSELNKETTLNTPENINKIKLLGIYNAQKQFKLHKEEQENAIYNPKEKDMLRHKI